MSRCIAGLGSVTQAMKAQTVLTHEEVPSKIIKLDSSMSKRGCAYGLEYSCLYRKKVNVILDSAELKFEEFVL
ncbi:MAG: DUF3343 domain-containing protein [Clostridiales bacterium]|nr:DUF3343 domain-containing protein [Clostridiales bacterium]